MTRKEAVKQSLEKRFARRLRTIGKGEPKTYHPRTTLEHRKERKQRAK